MKIYTSYFANPALRDSAVVREWTFFNVARGAPSWFKHPFIHVNALFKVAPSRDLLSAYKSERIDDIGYREIYQERLKKLPVGDFLRFLEDHTQERKILLLCWEKPSDFCHRHLLGQHIQIHGGIEVVEI